MAKPKFIVNSNIESLVYHQKSSLQMLYLATNFGCRAGTLGLLVGWLVQEKNYLKTS